MGDGTKTYLVWTQKDHLADEVSGHGEQSLEETVMNRNRKCSKKVAAGIAVGMAAVMQCSTGTGRRRGRIGIKRRDSIRQCRCLRK